MSHVKMHVHWCTTSGNLSGPCDYINQNVVHQKKTAVLATPPPCMSCTHTVRLISSEHHEISWKISVSTANLGCFIQPSRCMCPLASLSCMPGELPLSRHRPSVRCREQSLDMPHVAGRQGEHFGWHKAWHSEEIKTLLKRERAMLRELLSPLSLPSVPPLAQKEKGINEVNLKKCLHEAWGVTKASLCLVLVS